MDNEQSVPKEKDLSLKGQIAVLITFLAGVLASHFLAGYQAAVSPAAVFADWSWRYWIFAAIVTVAAFPVAYAKFRENTGSPTLVQIGMVFLTGMGWNTILNAAQYAAAAPPHP
jgi:hypothetical protein